tara:strand:+ start:6862 stop:7422 length:561 start_codon:yes stop_codon:yes gene_type:complete
MAFWTDNRVEPKRRFRFLMDITPAGEANRIASFFVRTSTKPNFQMDGTGAVKFIQHTFKYPGRITWQPISVTILDPVLPDSAAILMNILNNSGYTKPDDERNALQSISKAGANQAMGTIFLRQIDAEGRDIEEWKLWNPFLTQVDFGNVGYDDDALVEYTLTIDYDYATLKSLGTPGVNAGVSTPE